jgi:hypothetical protein
MKLRVVVICLALLALAPSAAFASLADEQTQGRALAAQVRSGAKHCSDLSSEDFDHVGEYVMGRALGSLSAHQAMNDRMKAMMGDAAESRMHQLLGQRYTGCIQNNGSTAGGMMGNGGMMGGSWGDWNSMMGSGDYSWMMGNGWRNMSRSDWQSLQRQWLGTTTPAANDHATLWKIATALLAAALLAAIAAAVLLRRRNSTTHTNG